MKWQGLMFVLCLVAFGTSAALAQSSGGTAVHGDILMGTGELVVVLLMWALGSYILFSWVFWRLFNNPFLGIRVAYFVTCAAVLAYMCWSFYPRYLEGLTVPELGYVRYVVAGAVLLLNILVYFITYRRMPEGDAQLGAAENGSATN